MFTAKGKIIPGFGRGGHLLGFPTANLDIDLPEQKDGVYYGYAYKDKIWEQCVMSIGYNPHFGDKKRTYEVHILKEYEEDFYGEILEIDIRGYLRPMEKFNSLEELIGAINSDISQAKELLKC